MDREDKILHMIYNGTLWIFLGFMVIVLCIAAARDRSRLEIIDELEQNIISLEERNDRYTDEIQELNLEIDSLNLLLETTRKQYEDRVSELQSEVDEYKQKELKSYSDESLYHSYKLTDDIWIN